MKIYFVRHGETDMNARNMFYGWYDADINEKGIAQAEELRAAFETIHIDAIYSSDLKRALSYGGNYCERQRNSACSRNSGVILW